MDLSCLGDGLAIIVRFQGFYQGLHLIFRRSTGALVMFFLLIVRSPRIELSHLGLSCILCWCKTLLDCSEKVSTGCKTGRTELKGSVESGGP